MFALLKPQLKHYNVYYTKSLQNGMSSQIKE